MRAFKITHAITRRDEKSLEKYLAEVARYGVLTPEEELALFRRLKSGDETALDKIVIHNLRFVVSVAKQYQSAGLWLGDLINEGNIGLIKAARRFDETKGFKFISYAVWWIRQSILQAINEKSRKIRLPLNQSSINNKIKAKRSEFFQQEEREPTLEELSEATGLKEEAVLKSLETNKFCTSLDAPLTEDEDGTLANVLEDSNAQQPDFDLSVLESQREEVQDMLSQISEREALVISLYYGIGGKRSLSLEDIGDQIGVSRERVRQIKDRGIKRLRLRTRDVTPTFSTN